MNTFSQQAIDFLTAQSLHVLVLFAAVLAATFLLRGRSAHIRYLLWLLVVVKCFVPPLHTVSLAVLPEVHSSGVSLPSDEHAEAWTTNGDDSVSSRIPYVGAAAQPTDEHADSQTANTVVRSSGFSLQDETRRAGYAHQSEEHAEAWTTNTAQPTEHEATSSFRVWIPAVWLVGAAVYFLVVAVKGVRFDRYVRRHRTAVTAQSHPVWAGFLAAAVGERPVRVYQLSRPGQPFVWGLWRGAIYLPGNFADVNDPHKQQSILMHEAGHILRFDPVVNFLQVVAQGLFWFHPLVWAANSRIRAEREKCCDEFAVATLKAAPRSYCSAIVDALMAAQSSRPPVPTLAVAGPVKNIEDRIKTLLAPNKRFYTRPTIAAMLTILLLAAIVVPTTVALSHRVQKPEVASQETGPSAEETGDDSVNLDQFVGHWQGQGPIIVNWTQQRQLAFDIDIQPDGSASGTIGDAELVNGQLRYNRNWFLEMMDWNSRYIIEGQLKGDIIAAEGIQRDSINLLFDNLEDNEKIKGGFHTSGTKFGGKNSMIMSGAMTLDKVSESAAENSKPFTAVLDNGVTVKLLGVCERPGEGRQWWRPDGTLLDDAPFDSSGLRTTPSSNYRAYDFAIRYTNIPEGMDSRFYAEPSVARSGGTLYATVKKDGKELHHYQDGRLVSAVSHLATLIHKDETVCTVKVGVSNGPWTTRYESVKSESSGGFSVSGQADSESGVVFGRPIEQDRQAWVPVTFTIDTNLYEVRIVAVCQDGTLHSPIRTQGAGTGDATQRTVCFDLPVKDISAILLQTRKYDWLTFKNVSLRPGVKTEVEVVAQKSE